MEKQLEAYLKGYRGLIIPHKLYKLALKDQRNASYYLTQACDYCKKNNYVGIYEDMYALQKKSNAFLNLQLPARDETWASTTYGKYKEESQKKENDIVRAVSNQMREGIRVGLWVSLAVPGGGGDHRYEVRLHGGGDEALLQVRVGTSVGHSGTLRTILTSSPPGPLPLSYPSAWTTTKHTRATVPTLTI